MNQYTTDAKRRKSFKRVQVESVLKLLHSTKLPVGLAHLTFFCYFIPVIRLIRKKGPLVLAVNMYKFTFNKMHRHIKLQVLTFQGMQIHVPALNE